MSESDQQIDELERRLDELVRTQIDFQKEITLIRGEIRMMRSSSSRERADRSFYVPPEPPKAVPKVEEPVRPRPPIRETPIYSETTYQSASAPNFGYSGHETGTSNRPDFVSEFFDKYTASARADLEKFIGENLISKIGILILIIGIGIGVKYSIDNNLISPLTRVILGYIFAFGLVGLAIKLKGKYYNFSAVLISGGIAAMYFVTYFGYSLYGLLGRESAFGLMAIFTIAAVAAALVYTRQVIAHIGLVGAYAVPFLLSNDSGNYLFLFVYISVINSGILAISLKRNWIPLYYTSFAFTWVIFASWFATRYNPEYFGLALVFLAIFFAIFLSAKSAHSIFGNRTADTETILAVSLNSIAFYGFCLAINNATLSDEQVVPFFTYLAAITAVGLTLWSRSFGGPLYYIAFGFIWLIFISWFAQQYEAQHFYAALAFLAAFYAMFHAILVFDDARKKEDGFSSLVCGVLNCVVFYGICLALCILTVSNLETAILFAYLSISTIATLLLSFRFFGKVLVYIPFAAVWLIYSAWYLFNYDPLSQFGIAAGSGALFFATFYVTTIAYKLARESFNVVENAALILTNSFLFYGFGYSILDGQEFGRAYMGLYTAAHGILHLVVAGFVTKLEKETADLVQILTVLILTFATIAIPVQFDGNVVTLVWAVEAAVLFWIGRSRGVKLFEYFSFPVMALACLSLAADWMLIRGEPWRPIANGYLVTAIVFVAAFAIIYFVNRAEEYIPAVPAELTKPIGYAFAAIAVFVLYNAFRLEIVNYFDLRAAAVELVDGNTLANFRYLDQHRFGSVWQINYSLFFVAAMGLINQLRLRSVSLAVVNSVLAFVVLFLFATIQMMVFYELRASYQSTYSEVATASGEVTNLAIRYISYIFAAGMLVVLYRYVRDELLNGMMEERSRLLIFETVFYTFMFIVGSCEVVNLMAQFQIADATKLGLSIFWGFFALAMVVAGIAWDKKHLRIAAIVLLGITLAKLFFYDITELATIPKTILFVTLGITLLAISFLYNKYKTIIFPALATAPPDEPVSSVTDAEL